MDFRRTQSKQILYKFTEMENAIKRTEMPEVMAYLWLKCAYLLTKSVISHTNTESIWTDVWKFPWKKSKDYFHLESFSLSMEKKLNLTHLHSSV